MSDRHHLHGQHAELTAYAPVPKHKQIYRDVIESAIACNVEITRQDQFQMMRSNQIIQNNFAQELFCSELNSKLNSKTFAATTHIFNIRIIKTKAFI